MFALTILGNNSALPAYGRHPTAQVLQMENQSILIDCGEGTQMQMNKYGIKKSKINHVFISHLHGDHYLGVAGLLNSWSLLNRTAPLYLFGPAPLEKILQMHFEVGHTQLSYPLYFQPLPSGEHKMLVDTDNFQVECFPTEHRIECFGFLFRQKKALRKINPEACQAQEVPYSYFDALKKGDDILLANGLALKNEDLTLPGDKAYSYAFCADNRYNENFLPVINGVDVMYHETTYLKDLEEKAYARYHSTTAQAALLAKKAHAGKLLIGHFSSQYENLQPFEKECREIFPNSYLALEGATFQLDTI